MGKKTKRSTFELAPAGNHMAIITGVAELGTQISTWNGQEKQQDKWGINFELVGPQTSKGTPYSIATMVTDSLFSKSRLFSIAKAALGEVGGDLDLEDLVGKAVQITVEHSVTDTGTWANVDQVSGLLSGMDVPETETPLLYFDLDSPDPVVYEKLPALFKKKIEGRVQQSSIGFDGDINL